MLARFFSHFLSPRIDLAVEKVLAALQGHRAFRVVGGNMEPTVQQNSIIRFRRLGRSEELAHGAIVVFTVPDFEGYAVPTRVIAVAGESVAIESGKLLINGERIAEPYVKVGFANADYSTGLLPQIVPQGCYFLMGDHRDSSKDSRYLGPIPSSAILGVAVVASEA